MAEYYVHRPMLTLRLECVSPGFQENIFRDTIHNAISVAAMLNVVTVVKMNDVQVYCNPDDDVDAKVDAFQNAQANNWPSVI